MIKKWDKLMCRYKWWGWTEYYDWTYEVIWNTEKVFRLKIIDEWFYNWFLKFIKNKDKIIIHKKYYSTRIRNWIKQYKINLIWINEEHFLDDWFYIYPNRCWIPYIFTKTKTKLWKPQ